MDYSDTRYYCPICGTRGLLKRLDNGTTILYCAPCEQELMVILDPIVQPQDEDKPDETRH